MVIQLLLKREAQDQLRVSRPTLDRMIGRGELPVIRLSARSIRISVSALDRFLEQRTVRRGPTGALLMPDRDGIPARGAAEAS
jgi:excisionase family DNA binding protein